MAKIGMVEKLKRLSKKKVLVISLVFVLVFVSILFFIDRNRVDDDIEEFDPTNIVTFSTDRPSEEDPSDFDVPADIPKRINLKSISKAGYIQMVSIDQNGDIAVPSNVLMAGWYVNSVRPGEEGLSILTGHRDGVMKKGIFRYLGDSKKGDSIEIEYGDGSKRYFEVVDVRQVSVEDAYTLMYEKRDSIDRQLNIVTCGGKFNQSLQSYDERIVVVSKGIE